ncbi:MAG: hypothetical protein AB7S42_07160 [Lysobacteraceae bacterium]
MTDVQRAPDASSVGDLEADLWPPPDPVSASPPARRGGSRVPTVVGGVVGALIGVAIARGALPWSGAQIGLGAIGAMLAIWPQMLVHEAGHVALGRLAGLRAYLLGLGRLRLERTGRGWRGYRGAQALGLGGFALMLPRDADFGRAAFCALGLGGVIANLAASAACVIAMDGFAPGQAWSPVLGGAAVTGFAMAVVNLVPFRHHGWSTDGMILLQVLRGDAVGRARFSAMRLLGLSYAGARPRDWPRALMPEACGIEDPLMRAHIHALHLASALDAGEAASAEAHARELVAMFPVLPPVVRGPVALAVAGHIAVLRRDPARLAAWLPLCTDGLADYSAHREWLHAERYALEGNVEAARERIARSRRADTADRGGARVLAELLDALEQRLDA